MQLIRRAPAKINLFLRVGRRGDDGFHPLLSWMCTIGLFDTLRFQFDREAAPASTSPRATLGRAPEPRLSLACDDPRLPVDARNLVWRAMKAIIEARGLADATPAQADAMSRAGGAANGEQGEISPADRDVGAVSAFLEKRIPAGAGLGGGSSDAATTLVAMNQLLGDPLTREQLAGLAASIGSDVPFFLQARSALCGGRGEIVHPFPPPTQARWALLVMPEIEMPTPAVYGKFDAMSLGDPEVSSKPPRQIVNDGLAAWKGHVALPSEQLLPQLINELEPPAFALRPEVGKLRSDIEQSLGRIVRMSGSGSSLFTLFDGEPHARQAAIAIALRHQVRAVAVQLAPKLDTVA